MNSLFPVAFLLLLPSCAAGLVFHAMLLSRLRSRHTQTWEALGRPSLVLNNTISNCLAVQRFLWRREYRGLGDERLARFASFLRYYEAAYIIFFGVLIVAFFSLSK
jgi:hypothetical protein